MVGVLLLLAHSSSRLGPALCLWTRFSESNSVNVNAKRGHSMHSHPSLALCWARFGLTVHIVLAWHGDDFIEFARCVAVTAAGVDLTPGGNAN